MTFKAFCHTCRSWVLSCNEGGGSCFRCHQILSGWERTDLDNGTKPPGIFIDDPEGTRTDE